MLANGQLTTILLLVAIGAIIYYIAQPSNIDNQKETAEDVSNEQTDEENNTNPEPINMEPQMSTSAQMAPVDENADETDPDVQVPELDSQELTGMIGDSPGASLDTAFMGAIPPNTATDQIDFNRNNVKEFDSSQFLPQEVNDEWFDTDFTKAKYNLNDDKMINTNRYIIGVNTVGQSLKNPSYDIRGTIPNPKYTVSPWNNSTYEPDNNLKPLC